MPPLIKKLAAKLPVLTQHRLKQRRFAAQIRRGRLGQVRPDLERIAPLVNPGDWVLDIGANIGEYTHWFSQQVGVKGRVIAVEPVRDTFALLASNLMHFQHDNVTLLNAAATDKPAVLGLDVPTMASGLTNFYQATVSPEGSQYQALGLVLDGLTLAHPVAVIKIDAEGHDAQALRGLVKRVERDRPILLLEQVNDEIAPWLLQLGYRSESVNGSANTVLIHGHE